MVKKKNRTLESVLYVIREFEGRFSQPIVEQILKEGEGDVDRAIEILRNIELEVSCSLLNSEQAEVIMSFIFVSPAARHETICSLNPMLYRTTSIPRPFTLLYYHTLIS